MLYSDNLSSCILAKNIFVISFVQMQYLLNQSSPLEYKSVNFEINIVD